MIAIIFVFSTACSAEQQTIDFGGDFFANTALAKVIVEKADTSSLTEKQIEDLTRAKETLKAFLINLNDGSPETLSSLSDDLRNTYSDVADLYSMEFDGEMLLNFEIHDFIFLKNSKELILYFFLTSTYEGIDCTTQKAIAFKMQGSKFILTRLPSAIRSKVYESSNSSNN